MQTTTPIAENHISISHKLFNEGLRAAGSKTYKKEIHKVILILSVLYVTVAVWLWYTGGSLFFLLSESIFLGMLLLWLIFMLPVTKNRSKYNAMVQGTDRIPKRITRFYSNHLSVTTETEKVTTIPYDDILGWQETRNLYILNCNKNIAVLLDKKGFAIGDFLTVTTMIFKK